MTFMDNFPFILIPTNTVNKDITCGMKIPGYNRRIRLRFLPCVSRQNLTRVEENILFTHDRVVLKSNP